MSREQDRAEMARKAAEIFGGGAGDGSWCTPFVPTMSPASKPILHVYHVEQWDGDEHWLAAESLEAAIKSARDRGILDDDGCDLVTEVPDDEPLTICACDEPGQPLETKKAYEWLEGLMAGDLVASTVVS